MTESEMKIDQHMDSDSDRDFDEVLFELNKDVISGYMMFTEYHWDIKGQLQHIEEIFINPENGDEVSVCSDEPEQEQEIVLCRFGAKCTRKDCKYKHDVAAIDANDKPCRFGAKCTNKVCKYKHAVAEVAAVVDYNKPCRFGAKCTNKVCKYEHEDVDAAVIADDDKPCRFGVKCNRKDCKFKHERVLCRFGAKCNRKDCTFIHE